MAPRYRWKDPEGRQTITTIVKKLIPQWKNGLHPFQHQFVVLVLDGGQGLCLTATSDGKSAIFAVPIIVLVEMSRHPELYPDLPVRPLPIGLVITPTKGLAANIVLELKKLGEIMECKKWKVVCVDPEHLRVKAWREITASETFRANITYGCSDEAHLIKEWGAGFRPQFRHIGTFFRGRLPSSTLIFGLSATLQPGAATNSVCKSLGMLGDTVHVLRRSNERPNTQFIMQALAHGLGGRQFPLLLPYLNAGRKTVIHCRTIADVFSVFMCLWNCQQPGPGRLKRVQMYHSLRSSEDNEKILQLLEDEPECQIVIATIAFSNGLNVKALLDSIYLGFPDTVDQLWQEKGRVGRNPDTSARGIVLYQPSVLAAAEKQLSAPAAAPSPPPQPTAPSAKPKRKRKVKPMEHAEALVLVEKTYREQARLAKNAKQRAAKTASKRRCEVSSEDEMDEEDDDSPDEEEADERSSPEPPRAKRRRALATVTNTRMMERERPAGKKKRTVAAASQSVVAITETYRPPYRISRRRAVGND
ncbi:P-loop containing nucleoside triphosphate hydrolase protein [Mycena maculata]|uniref:DNA 3'-5' helicase n=1 Tax=Mycena maculata TaxID=230809 RepID=A0AAD7NSA8_9AGAR|nr:P-loop containing nucleoside triphosphate hydrolase protein [Mycena maculata]